MNDEIKKLQKEVSALKLALNESNDSLDQSEKLNKWLLNNPNNMPAYSSGAQSVKTVIENNLMLDFKPQLNTSSYVNIKFEKEEQDIALMGLKVNLADQTVYPQSYKIHDWVVNMIANLWHCPKPEGFDETGTFAGAGTVGSTEACLLAGLALKFRWRKWYAKRYQVAEDKILKERPNIIISTCYQAAWEKLIKYMDIDCQLIAPSSQSFTIDPEEVRNLINDHTIGVICIMGNHYSGHYDPVFEVNKVLNEVNKANDFQVGIHVDAASGGFIAPFQENLPAWDFRLNNVLSISASGHKYGVSCCGTGWIVWRERKGLSEHVAISVTYLGGKADSYTLNFSRPASGVYVQYYKLLRYGIKGYQESCNNMMGYAKMIRDGLTAMMYKGKPRFILLDHGDAECLPVITAMLNPESGMAFDDVDLQHALSQHHWYVSAYKMGFNHPLTEKMVPLFTDQKASKTMFRVVVKNNLTDSMVLHLLESFRASLILLDSSEWTHSSKLQADMLRHKDQVITNHC